MRKVLLAITLFLTCAWNVSAEPVIGSEHVLFRTNFGDIVLGLYPEVAPKHTAQILRMTKAGVYDGMRFFRLISGFIVQIENYDTRKVPLSPEQTATVEKIPAEFSAIKHQRGLLSMARYDDPNSAEASFSIMLGDAPHLDGQYTIFGKVIAGMDVVDAIEHTPVAGESPTTDIVVEKAVVIDDAELSRMQLRGVQNVASADAKEKLIFEIFAAVMFCLTIAAPIVKSLFTKAPAAAKA